MAAEADLGNWRTSHHNKWAFIHVDQILRTKLVEKSKHTRALHEARDGRVEALKIPLAEGHVPTLDDLLRASHTDALVVLHRGRLIHDYFANGNSPKSKHIVMSMTKSMTGLITGALIENGTIKEDDQVTQHLPELKNTAFVSKTIRHLLDMRSGINYPDTSPEYRAAAGWTPADPQIGESDFQTFFQGFSPPGTKTAPSGFFYATVNTDVLGLLFERVTGKSYAELLHEHVFEPAGAAYDALVTVDKSGMARAGGGLAASVMDLARIGQALIDGKLASTAWLESMLSGDTQVFAESAWGPAFKPFSTTLAYRSFWVTSGVERLCIAMGIHGQTMIVDLENEIVMVKTGSLPEPSDPKASGLIFRLFRTLQHVLSS